MKQDSMERFTISLPKDIYIEFCQKAATENHFKKGWKGKGFLKAVEMYVGDDSK